MDVGVAGPGDGVQSAQVVAVGLGRFRRPERVEDRLVVLVHEHRHPLACTPVQCPQQVLESQRRDVVARGNPCVLRGGVELRHHLPVQIIRLAVAPAAEVEPHHRPPHRPVPSVVHRQPAKQRLVALEQLLQGVQEQASSLVQPRQRLRVGGLRTHRYLEAAATSVSNSPMPLFLPKPVNEGVGLPNAASRRHPSCRFRRPHMPHTWTSTPAADSRRWNTLSSHARSLRSKMTRCPASAAQRSM